MVRGAWYVARGAWYVVRGKWCVVSGAWVEFYDAMLFVDAMTGVRAGVEFAHYADHYVDGTRASNNRVQLAGMFLF